MEKILKIVTSNIIISIGIYFVVAIVLIIINGKSKTTISDQKNLSFDELAIDYSGLPKLEPYLCRDGVDLNSRYYPSQINKVLILIHGSGWHSQYFLPYLKYNAPTMRLNSGGWASVHLSRIIGLSMLNKAKITLFNYLKVIDFNMPKEFRDGTETLSYSYRLNTGYAPINYKKDLTSIEQKLLVVVGESDESFIAEEFPPEISKYKKDVEVKLIKNVTHMGVVVGEEIKPILKEWINKIN